MNLFGQTDQSVHTADTRGDLRETHTDEMVVFDGIDIRQSGVLLELGDLLVEIIGIPDAYAVVADDDVLRIRSDNLFPVGIIPGRVYAFAGKNLNFLDI